VRHLTASARADAEATEAVFESVRLALTSDVAASYFTLRAVDQELTLLKDNCVTLLANSLVLMRYGRDRRLAIEPSSRNASSAAAAARSERRG